MCATAFIGRAAWRFSMRLAMAAAAAEAMAPRSPVFSNEPSSLGSADAADDLAGSAAVAAALATRGLALAVALRADVLAGSRGAGFRLVARIERLLLRSGHALAEQATYLA